jgi:hypothetical protein
MWRRKSGVGQSLAVAGTLVPPSDNLGPSHLHFVPVPILAPVLLLLVLVLVPQC